MRLPSHSIPATSGIKNCLTKITVSNGSLRKEKGQRKAVRNDPPTSLPHGRKWKREEKPMSSRNEQVGMLGILSGDPVLGAAGEQLLANARAQAKQAGKRVH